MTFPWWLIIAPASGFSLYMYIQCTVYTASGDVCVTCMVSTLVLQGVIKCIMLPKASSPNGLSLAFALSSPGTWRSSFWCISIPILGGLTLTGMKFQFPLCIIPCWCNSNMISLSLLCVIKSLDIWCQPPASWSAYSWWRLTFIMQRQGSAFKNLIAILASCQRIQYRTFPKQTECTFWLVDVATLSNLFLSVCLFLHPSLSFCLCLSLFV